MEPILIKPVKEQKSFWFFIWSIWFVLGAVPGAMPVLLVFIFILDYPDNLISALVIIAWLIIMAPILIWISAFYKSLEYVIDSDSIKSKKGVFWKKHVTVPYTKVTNIDITQGPFQRMFKIGTIHVQTAGAGGSQGAPAELKLLGIKDLEELKEIIMERVRGFVNDRFRGTKEENIELDKSKIFNSILEELSAIRKILESKSH